MQDQLFGLYMDVINTFTEWSQIDWSAVTEKVETMTDVVEAFALRCKKMPTKMREFTAYADLKKEIVSRSFCIFIVVICHLYRIV